jgi:ABC-type Mn2+/Zn2+ transport system permease subunit
MYWKRPSFLGFILQGILLAIFFIYFINNYKSLNNKEIIYILLLSSIAIGVHSILHDREERYYGYNPIMNI